MKTKHNAITFIVFFLCNAECDIMPSKVTMQWILVRMNWKIKRFYHALFALACARAFQASRNVTYSFRVMKMKLDYVMHNAMCCVCVCVHYNFSCVHILWHYAGIYLGFDVVTSILSLQNYLVLLQSETVTSKFLQQWKGGSKDGRMMSKSWLYIINYELIKL